MLPFELPALVLPAISALLFLLAWPVFGKALVRSLSISLPVVGNVIASLVEDVLDDAYAALTYWFDALVTPAVNFLLAPLAAIENTVSSINTVLDAVTNQLGLIYQVQVPQMIAWAGAGADNAYVGALDGALAYTDRSVDWLRDIVVSNYDAIEAQLKADEAATATAIANVSAVAVAGGLSALQVSDLATTAAQAVVGAAVTDLDGLVSSAITTADAYATSLFNRVETDLANGIATAQTYTQTALAGVAGVITTDIDNAISGAISGIWADVDTATQAAIGVIGTDLPDIAAGLKAIPRAIPADIAGVSALTGATAWALSRYLEECGIPNCRNLSAVGRDLQDLFAIVGDASFLTFLLALIRDPGNAAATIDDAFGDAVSTGISEVRSLIGV